MINSVTVSKTGQSQSFSDFKQPKSGYYFDAKYLDETKDNKSHKLGITLTVSALLIGFGTLALLRGGFNKSSVKFLDKWKQKLEQKIAKGDNFKNLYRFVASQIDLFLGKMESINNFTTLKDVFFQRLMWGKNGQRGLTKSIHQKVTKYFERIGRKTVNLSYAKTQRKFATLTDYMSDLNAKIIENNPSNKELAAKIEKINLKIQNVNENLDKGFGINARLGRLKKIRKASDGLFQFFWDSSLKDLNNFRSKNMYQSFIAEDYMLPAKMKLMDETNVLRNIITHDISDSYESTLKVINNIQKFVSPLDENTNKVMNALRENLEAYKKLSGVKEASDRKLLNEKIIANLVKLNDSFKLNPDKYHYNSEDLISIKDHIFQVKNILKDTSKGQLQELLSEYKSILPNDKYLSLKSKVEAAVKSLDKSIDTETVQYFDKARDLKLGSAPTDVLSILFTMGTVGYYLNKADNKDDRYSVSLKYGIPAVGAIATSLYSTARLVSGGKALIFGLVSGWVMNKIGTMVDDMRKKYSFNISFSPRDLLKPTSDKV